jgi:hypothetical protein
MNLIGCGGLPPGLVMLQGTNAACGMLRLTIRDDPETC